MLYPLSYTGTIPVAGLEPATSRVTGEVTLVFTTGRNLLSLRHYLPTSAGEHSNRESRPIFSGTLRFGATPPSRKLSASARFATLLGRFERSTSALSPPAKLHACSHTSAPAPDPHLPHWHLFTTVDGQGCPSHNFLWPGNRRSRKGLRPEASNLTTCPKNKPSTREVSVANHHWP